MKPVHYLSPAENELFDAARYYEIQVAGLGLRFMNAMDAAVADIGSNPERWPLIRNGVRRRLLRQFPYALLYRVDPDEVAILAVMHLSRRPNYWSTRNDS